MLEILEMLSGGFGDIAPPEESILAHRGILHYCHSFRRNRLSPSSLILIASKIPAAQNSARSAGGDQQSQDAGVFRRLLSAVHRSRRHSLQIGVMGLTAMIFAAVSDPIFALAASSCRG
jgi:hypothetical protein